MSWSKRVQARLLAPLAIVAAVAVGAAALALADSLPAPAVTAGATKVQLRRGPLGRYLVDGHGRSLYLFEKDRGGRSSCYGSCASVWPPLIAAGHVAHGPGVSAGGLGSVARRGGGREVTYGGHPLYFYAGDSRPGQTRGEGLNQFGAKWYVLAASGHKIDKD
jgi:predicted lipoprotein with Yx(FWY)xxD motif